MSDDGYWSDPGTDPVEPSVDAAGTDSGSPALTPDATSLLTAFATGGLSGLISSLEEMGDSTADGIDDPEALRRAELAVALGEPLSAGKGQPIDEDWSVVARQAGTVVVGLDELARTLEAHDIAIGWDPYDPRESVAFMPPWTDTVAKQYSLMVPGSQVAQARQVLSGMAPDGVTFAWEVTADAPGAGRSASVAGGPLLSDNARLQHLAGGGPSGAAIALALGGGLFVIGIALYMLLRG